MNRFYAVLDGNHPELGIEELYALCVAYGIKPYMHAKERIVIIEAELNEKITERIAYSKEIGRIVFIADRVGDISFHSDLFVKGTTFKVDAVGFDTKRKMEIDAQLGSKIMDIFPDCEVSLRKPDKIVRVMKLGDKFLVGITAPKVKRRWIDRRPRSRPFFHPVAIYPKLARLLVNLCSIKEGEIFVDPCCGTGSLLVEAANMGMDTFGLDISKKMVYGAKKNSILADKSKCDFALADSHSMPVRYADGIATDIPYGRAGPSFDKSLDISRSILEQAPSLLPSGGRAVIMSNLNQLPAASHDMQLLRRYSLYVHRSLTRVISIFERR